MQPAETMDLGNSIPTYIGGYQITGRQSPTHNTMFSFVKKPNAFHRFFCRVLLGWVWKDN
jgi:hypothetical protein